MGYHHIISSSEENREHFSNFLNGYEPSLTYIYHHFSSSLHRYGLRIVKDEFVINTIVQEAFLKLWALRERMTSMDHIVRFLKLTMRWECMAYYRHPMETLYRNALRLNWMETWDVTSPMPEETIAQTENRLHLVRSMIPRLPGNRQRTIVSFYVKEGMSVAQISSRLRSTTQSVSQELHEGLAHLRAMLAIPQRKEAVPVPVTTSNIKAIANLNKEQSHIITLRRDMKYTFSQIADLLKLPQSYVQKQYVEAWKKCPRNEL